MTDIKWLPVRDIPNKPSFDLTVKREDGELINTRVQKDPMTGACHLKGITAAEIKGWIPNDQL